jgi:hypothetical protein
MAFGIGIIWALANLSFETVVLVPECEEHDECDIETSKTKEDDFSAV